MEDRVANLLLTASRVRYITVRLLCPNVNVIHKYTNSNSTSLVLIQIKVAAVLAGHAAIEVPCVSHTLKSLVLYCNNSPLLSRLRSVKENTKTLIIWSVSKHIVEFLWKLGLISEEKYGKTV